MVCDRVQEHYCFESKAHREPWEGETGAMCQCSRDLKDLGVRRKGAPRPPAPRYCSCQPPSTDMRGPTMAQGFNLELVSAAWRWLILYSYHSAPWEPQLLFPCHHTVSVAATLQFLPNQSSPWQGLSLVLRPGGSWGRGSVTLRAASSGGLLCLCSVWRYSHRPWNAVLGVLGEGPPKRERRKGGGEHGGGGGGVTFEQCRQEVMTQFSTMAVKQRVKG